MVTARNSPLPQAEFQKRSIDVSLKNTAYRSETEPTNALRILMADDDSQEHLLMSVVAEGSPTPLIFDFVPDGVELLRELYVPTSLSDLPNLIILDLRMPVFDGARTLHELQRHPIFWQIPVVVFTSSGRRKDEAMSYERGAVLFETKPSSFTEMEAFLEGVVHLAKNANDYRGERVSEYVADLTDATMAAEAKAFRRATPLLDENL